MEPLPLSPLSATLLLSNEDNRAIFAICLRDPQLLWCTLILHCLSPGVMEDWKKHFSPEQNEKFNAIYQAKMGDLGLHLPWTMD